METEVFPSLELTLPPQANRAMESDERISALTADRLKEKEFVFMLGFHYLSTASLSGRNFRIKRLNLSYKVY